MTSSARALFVVAAAAGPALADPSGGEVGASARPVTPEDLDVRLTLSSFLYRESGTDAPPIVDQGATLQNASPVRRYFGDLRLELTDQGFAFDGRVRETTSARFQSGAGGGGEYEVRQLAYKLGGDTTSLTIGRQYIDAVGATKIDGLAFRRRLVEPLAATIFAGTFPQLGSRSLDTDYPTIRNLDGTTGSHLIPVAGGLGASYQTANYHGDVGVAGVYVAQAVPDATTEQKSRVFTTSTGYWKPASIVDVYHFVLLDVAGQNRVALTNGSAGIDVRPTAALQLSASVNHVAIDVLQIAARNLLADPDPSTIGVVQNDIAVIRVSQDVARAGASVGLAARRFELSASGGLHRRPALSVALADGTGAVVFPETRSADATFTVLDRRSLAGLRASLSATLTQPIGTAPTSTRGTSVRLAVARAFAQDRGQIDVDATAARFATVGTTSMCTTSLDPLACFSASKTTVAQLGALASWRAGRDWLVLADLHVGYRDGTSAAIGGEVVWPHVYAVTSFLRVQWRYH